jgi:hypothetical protein
MLTKISQLHTYRISNKYTSKQRRKKEGSNGKKKIKINKDWRKKKEDRRKTETRKEKGKRRGQKRKKGRKRTYRRLDGFNAKK